MLSAVARIDWTSCSDVAENRRNVFRFTAGNRTNFRLSPIRHVRIVQTLEARSRTLSKNLVTYTRVFRGNVGHHRVNDEIIVRESRAELSPVRRRFRYWT